MSRATKSNDPVLDELVAIKKLLILMLLNGGLTQSQVGDVLEIDRSQISRMVPTRGIKSKKRTKK